MKVNLPPDDFGNVIRFDANDFGGLSVGSKAVVVCELVRPIQYTARFLSQDSAAAWALTAERLIDGYDSRHMEQTHPNRN